MRIINVSSEEQAINRPPRNDFQTFRLHLTVPRQFLDKIDRQAGNLYVSRSDYIRMALMEKMNVKSLFEDELDKLYRHPD